MIIKAIICRSNPHSIRVINASKELTLVQFESALDICFGGAGWSGYEWSGVGCECGVGEKLEDVIRGENYLLKNKNLYGPDIRLEISSITEDEQVKLSLVDSRGYNIPASQDTVLGCNKVWNKIYEGINFYNEKTHSWISEKDITPQIGVINKRLNKLLNGGVTAGIDRRMLVSYEHILNEKNVSELKQICIALGIPTYGNMKRRDMIFDIQNEIEDEQFLRWFLDICSWSEYRAIKQLVNGKANSEEKKRECFSKLIYLSSFYLVDIKGMTIAAEFAESLEEWFSEVDEEFEFLKEFALIINGCCKLYGFTNEMMAMKTFERMFPERDTKLVLAYWNFIADSKRLSGEVAFEDGIYYNKEDITLTEAEKSARDWEQNPDEWYQADTGEFIEISEHGLTMEKQIHEKLVSTIRYMAGNKGYMARSIAYDIVAKLHAGLSVKDIMTDIKLEFGYYNGYYSTLEKVINEGKGSVRKLKNKCYTDEEMAKRN